MLKSKLSLIACVGIGLGLFSWESAALSQDSNSAQSTAPSAVKQTPPIDDKAASYHKELESMMQKEMQKNLSSSSATVTEQLNNIEQPMSTQLEQPCEPTDSVLKVQGVDEERDAVKADAKTTTTDPANVDQLSDLLKDPELKAIADKYHANPCVANEVLYHVIQGAAEGEAKDQAALGDMYRTGFEVKQDYKKAMSWYQVAAKQNNNNAQYSISYMYAMGQGVDQSYEQARIWSEKAAQQGNSMAEFMLANMYLKGLSVEKNYSTALEWFQKAADQDNPDAQYSLALMHANGLGVKINYFKAREFLEKAAKQQHLLAMRMLGSFCFTGKGGQMNPNRAMDLWTQACAKGDKESCRMMNR